MSCTNDVKSRIAALRYRKGAVQLPTIDGKGQNFLWVFFGVFIAMLTLATFGLFVTKYIDKSEYVSAPQISDTNYITYTQANSLVHPLAIHLQELEKRIDLWQRHAWLAGVASNENANVNKKIHPDWANRYITLNREWKMNKMPESMKLTEEERNMIELSK